MYINCLKCVQCQIYFSVNCLPLMIIVLLDKLVVVQQIRFLKFWVTVVFIMVYKSLLWDQRKSVCNLLISLGGNFNIIFLSTHSPYILRIHSITMLSTHHHISWGLILILSLYVIRCLIRGLFASVLTTTAVCADLIPFIQATCPTLFFLLDFKILITHGEECSSFIHVLFSLSLFNCLSVRSL